MMTNPIDQDLAMQSPSSTSPLPWLSQTNRTSKKLLTSSFPTGKHQVWNFSLLYSLFLLRNVLGSSLESSSQVHRFTHQKKDNPTQKSSPYLIFLAAPDRKYSSKKEASFNSLKLSSSHTFWSSHKERKILSCKSTYIYIYIYIHMLF